MRSVLPPPSAITAAALKAISYPARSQSNGAEVSSPTNTRKWSGRESESSIWSEYLSASVVVLKLKVLRAPHGKRHPSNPVKKLTTFWNASAGRKLIHFAGQKLIHPGGFIP